MNSFVIACVCTGFAVALASGLSAQELKCVQKPIAWMVGQENRIVIETPGDCGQLEVAAPKELELFDRWPWRQGDTQQKLYFRAKSPLAEGRMAFKAGRYSLDLPVQVLSWPQAREPRQFEKYQLPRIFPIEGKDGYKQGITFVDEEWLGQLRKEGLPNADSLAKALPDLETLFYRMPASTVPRAVYVELHTRRGCPVCGPKIYQGRSAFYPWVLDYEKHPWKVGCPDCGRWFPSNDFAKGDMHSGDMPDDGWGYFPKGEKYPYCFVSYYACMAYIRHYRGLPYAFAEQYSRSGDRRFARAAAVSLFRIAEQFFNLALNLNMRKTYTRQAVWNGRIVPQSGVNTLWAMMFVECNWEAGLVGGIYAPAYEMLWDYLQSDDAELLSFLQAHGHPEMKRMADVRQFIEDGYFRTAAQACMDGSMIGNQPQGQRAAAELALFLNSPRSPELVRWVLDGGGMRFFLTNHHFIDGAAYESPGYNVGHTISLQAFADVLEKIARLNPDKYGAGKSPTPRSFGGRALPLLMDDPKYRQMYDFWLNYNMIGRTSAQVGDSGNVAGTDPEKQRQTSNLAPDSLAKPYARFKDPRYAMSMYDPEKRAATERVQDAKLRADIEKVVAERGCEIAQPSNVLDGFGHVILRAGKGDDRRALWLRYGRQRGHNHDDILTIGYEGKMRTVLPEIGYYRSDNFRPEWDTNWAVHYCGRIVGDPYYYNRGYCTLFADGPWVRVATACHPEYEVVPPPQIYKLGSNQIMERTVALIDLDEKDSYVVDIFHLKGGTDHYWSFHGPQFEKEAAIVGLKLTKQERGTLAGPEFPYAKSEKWAKENPHLLAWTFLYGVERGGVIKQPWSLDWPLKAHPNIHVRMTALTNSDTEVNLAKGFHPGGGTPFELQWAIQHTRGEKPLHSQFVDIIELYEGPRRLTDIQRLPVQAASAGHLPPVAVQVTAGERTDIVISSRDRRECAAGGVSTDAQFAVWSETNGKLERAYMVGGTFLKKGDVSLQPAAAEWRGRIVAVDYRKSQITVRPAASYPGALVGRYVRLTNDFSDCQHLIKSAANQGDATVLTLDLDPRIGEGPVTAVADGALTSGVRLVLWGKRYYHGKTLTNEDGSVVYRVTDAHGGETVYLDQSKHGVVPAKTLEKQFADLDADGLKRFVIYDYGVGDEACVPFSVSLRKSGESAWHLETPVDVRLQLPGQKMASIKPGQESEVNDLILKPSGACGVAITVKQR